MICPAHGLNHNRNRTYLLNCKHKFQGKQLTAQFTALTRSCFLQPSPTPTRSRAIPGDVEAEAEVDVDADPDVDLDVEAKTEMEGDRDADGDGEAWVDCVRDEGGFGVLFPCCRCSFHAIFLLRAVLPLDFHLFEYTNTEHERYGQAL
jgi:hypothetical protein